MVVVKEEGGGKREERNELGQGAWTKCFGARSTLSYLVDTRHVDIQQTLRSHAHIVILVYSVVDNIACINYT